MIPSPWLTASEAAELLHCSVQTIYRRIENGRIPASALYPREKGEAVQIKRSFLTGDTATITQMPTRLTTDDIQRIADAAADAVITRLFPAMAKAS